MNPLNLNTHDWDTLMDQWFGEEHYDSAAEDMCLHLDTHQVPSFTHLLTVCTHCDEVIKDG